MGREIHHAVVESIFNGMEIFITEFDSDLKTAKNAAGTFEHGASITGRGFLAFVGSLKECESFLSSHGWEPKGCSALNQRTK